MATPKGFEQRVWFLLTGTPGTLTVAQIAAGTEITDDLPAPVSFAGTTNFIDVSDIGSRQDKFEAGTLTPTNLEFEVYRRNPSSGEIAIPALDDDAVGVLVKFEGGGIAGASPAAADVYDAVAVTIGTKSDVSFGRNESGRMTVPMGITGEIVRAAAVLA